MWFVSTPSLAISFVLAVFYVASLVFYAVNRQYEKSADHTVEMTFHSRESQQTILLGVSQNASNSFEPSCSADFSQFTPFKSQFSNIFVENFAVLNSIRLSLPDITAFVSNSRVCWKLFSRPPPAI